MEHCEEIALLSNEDISRAEEVGKEAFEAYWKRVAVIMLLTSVVIQLGLGTTILVFALKEKSLGGFGLGVNIMLDVITTLVVIWKYLFRNDETRACVIIALLFIISGVALNIKAVYNLSKEWVPFLKPKILLPVESAISITFGLLMIGKIYVAKKLGSKSLFVDGINTGCGLITAVMNLVSILVFRKTNLWFIDSISSVIISLFLFFFGLRLLFNSLSSNLKGDDQS